MKYIDFFRNEKPHPRTGMYLKDILKWNDEAWERTHDFIQWVFPTKRMSDFNLGVPELSDEEIQEFRGDKEVQKTIDSVYNRFCEFLEIDTQGDEAPWWLHARNHNLLRVTRALDSLKTLSTRGQHSRMILQLRELVTKYPNHIPDVTIQFWEAAISDENSSDSI